jgi:hypothetical protein
MYQSDALTNFQKQLAALVQFPLGRGADDDRMLRSVVSPIVRELKAAGWPPERVVVAMKQITAGACVHRSAAQAAAAEVLAPRDRLLARVVTQSIECYFDEGSTP